jgi:TetR/AcrR family transcriptional regulator, regulator of autoinduction and epiphytic fitness
VKTQDRQERKLTRREEQARLTRLEVIEAAQRLFIAQGYAATSLRAVAEEAGVSEQTVYRVFGDKAELLRAALFQAVGGQGNTKALREDARTQELAALPTPSARLEAVGRLASAAYERGLAELEEVVLAAVAADERVGELARSLAAERYEDTRVLIEAVVGDADLPAGIDLADVVDYLYAVDSSAVYLTLTRERGWTPEQYVAWFVRLVDRMFLRGS